MFITEKKNNFAGPGARPYGHAGWPGHARSRAAVIDLQARRQPAFSRLRKLCTREEEYNFFLLSKYFAKYS